MASLSIQLADDREAFAPGEILEGKAAWQMDQPQKKIFLRLFWFTRGKGTEDIEVVSETVFDNILTSESRSFKITLPQSPYSFSGRLVSLIWALELVASVNETAVTREIVISPFGYEIDLLKNKNQTS